MSILDFVKKHILPHKETVITMSIALAITLILRTFLFDPFHVPSGSMIPTLLPGDKMFVAKYAYGYSKHSFPKKIIPLKGKIFNKSPQHGDIVVFALPANEKVFYVKRLIALPGDTVQVKKGILFINDAPLERSLLTPSSKLDYQEISGNSVVLSHKNKNPEEYQLYSETNQIHKQYSIIHSKIFDLANNTKVFTVPEGHCFVMGDNRDNSLDSRFPEVGFIPLNNIIGRPSLIFFSSEKSFFVSIFQPNKIRFKRIFTSLITKKVIDNSENISEDNHTLAQTTN